MKRIFLLFILLVCSTILFSAEVTLRSENVFLCDLLEENKDYAIIEYKDTRYKIPRSKILAINTNKSGNHSSFQNAVLTLSDETVIKGELIEESPNMITIRKDDEILAIPRDTVSNFKKPDSNTFTLLESYKIAEKEKEELNWTLGFHGLAFRNGYSIGDYSYASNGGGIFIEPSFLKINNRWLFGFHSEFFSTGGKLYYSFFQNFLYVQFNHILIGQNIYYKLGFGSSYISLTESGQSASTLKMAGTFEIGWQNLIFERYIFRVGLRQNGIYERPEILDMLGLQVSIGYRF